MQISGSKLYHLVRCSAAATLLLLATGCSVRGTPSLPQVYGGIPTNAGRWQNVVAITKPDMGIFCSGTAITPQLVVTAAHCARNVNADEISVYVGDGVDGGRFLGQYPVAAIAASPLWGGSGTAGNDIAYIVLASPLRLAASAYIPVAVESSELDELLTLGNKGRMIGFGKRDNGSYGLKYQVDAPIVQVGELEIKLGGNGKDTCQGDSGGPLFQQLSTGEWRFVGVTSRGGKCGSGGVYGLLYKNICWIEQESSGQDLRLPAGSCS